MPKYQGPYHLVERELQRKFSPGETVFVCDMLDLFAADVPSNFIGTVLEYASKFDRTDFLFLTKNPKHYLDFQKQLQHPNFLLGMTLETSYDESNGFQFTTWQAPERRERIRSFVAVEGRKFLSIEPVMEFSLLEFFNIIRYQILPEFVYIGYDNYKSHLPEPQLLTVTYLIDHLTTSGIEVRAKTLRERIL